MNKIMKWNRNILRYTGVIGFTAIVVGCGGGGGSSPVAGSAPVIKGTAASGSALQNVSVTLKDSTNKSVNSSTNATGDFSISTAGLTAPFILSVTKPDGTNLYSVSVDANNTGTINITPLTDLILRSWYSLKGSSVDTAFSNPTKDVPPNTKQVHAIAQAVLKVLRLTLSNHNVSLDVSEDLISKPFVADHTGLDKVLDDAKITVGKDKTNLNLHEGGTTESTDITYDTTTTSIIANSTATNGNNVTTNLTKSIIPVQADQVLALDGINATLTAFANVINSKKTALVAADIIDFFDPNLMNEGLNRTQFVNNIVNHLNKGQTVSFVVDEIEKVDATTGLAEVEFQLTETLGTVIKTNDIEFFFRNLNGKWVLSGDQSIAKVDLHSEARRDQGVFKEHKGSAISSDVSAIMGTISSVVSSSSLLPPFTRNATRIEDGIKFDTFFSGTNDLAPPLPAAGTLFDFTLNNVGGGSVKYTIPLNAFTTELIQVTSPTASTLVDANLDNELKVVWTLPTTYAVASVQLIGLTFTGSSSDPNSFQCTTDKDLGKTSTTGTLVLPSLCNGLPVKEASINVNINGIHGERSTVIYGFR